MLITVTQLNNYLRGVVDMDSTLSNIEVSGELTNVRQSHGCWYFAIKDEFSQIDCFAWVDGVAEIIGGTQIVARGSINFYSKTGKLSLHVNKVIPVQQGQASLQFQQLKDKLVKLGYFDIAKKKNLPYIPTAIGVVTSREGAVIKDIVDVVKRRQPFTDIVLYPVKVQGENAAREIVQGIRCLSNTSVDLIIVARGGGSEEDLSVFNDEDVVIAVANSCKPTISAVGHGIDSTLCDFVADVRAITPTEAGELSTIDTLSMQLAIKNMIRNIFSLLTSNVAVIRNNLVNNIRHISDVYDNHILRLTGRIHMQLNGIMQCNYNCLKDGFARVDKQLAVINSNNPLVTMRRGYAILYKDVSNITSITQLSVGDDIKITLHDGATTAKITEVNDVK